MCRGGTGRRRNLLGLLSVLPPSRAHRLLRVLLGCWQESPFTRAAAQLGLSLNPACIFWHPRNLPAVCRDGQGHAEEPSRLLGHRHVVEIPSLPGDFVSVKGLSEIPFWEQITTSRWGSWLTLGAEVVQGVWVVGPCPGLW